MNTLGINIDLITGWFPMTVVIVAVASVVLSVGWHDGAWKWELPIGIPVSFGLTLLTALAIHIFNLVPDEFPTSFYLWAWLLWYSVVIIVLGWTRAHWILRTFSVLAMVFCILAAFTVVNQTFDYYPTMARLFGKDAANFADLPQLKAIRTETRKTGKLPDHGETITLPIPGTVSKFHASPAFVYLPPIWFKSPEPQLPVIELIAGVPGEPSDWTRAGYADTTATSFAQLHHGISPILVIPDNNGPSQDTECSNSSMGNAETYLITDVPNFMQANFNAAVGKHSLAVAGLSDGGTCASMLALRNPTIFQTFASYSGYNVPTYLNDNAQQTISALYGGSTANYDAHSPQYLLTNKKFPGLAGWFAAGQQDGSALGPAKQLADLAGKAGFQQVCLTTPPGTHSFTFWASAFQDSLPWLSWRLGITPPPTDVAAHCEPPVP
jgi:enterochelin esterase-like enzyme